jgi:hypothetical protein
LNELKLTWDNNTRKTKLFIRRSYHNDIRYPITLNIGYQSRMNDFHLTKSHPLLPPRLLSLSPCRMWIIHIHPFLLVSSWLSSRPPFSYLITHISYLEDFILFHLFTLAYDSAPHVWFHPCLLAQHDPWCHVKSKYCVGGVGLFPAFGTICRSQTKSTAPPCITDKCTFHPSNIKVLDIMQPARYFF